MGPRGGGGVNTKVQAALDKKKAHEAQQKGKEAQKAEERAAAEWSKGANLRKQSRLEAQVNKADEQLRKKREKEELLRQEEAANGGSGGGSSGKPKAGMSGMQKKQQQKKKKKGGNDISLLEDSLVAAADKKAKASKREARLKKEAEERKRKEMALKQTNEEASLDPLLANTNAILGVSENDDILNRESDVGRRANQQRGQDGPTSGLDGAIQSLSIGTHTSADQHPEKRMKALHKAFEERMMIQMKEDYPGLKMSQYKEKIFVLWKKSPENPMNQQH